MTSWTAQVAPAGVATGAQGDSEAARAAEAPGTVKPATSAARARRSSASAGGAGGRAAHHGGGGWVEPPEEPPPPVVVPPDVVVVVAGAVTAAAAVGCGLGLQRLARVGDEGRGAGEVLAGRLHGERQAERLAPLAGRARPALASASLALSFCPASALPVISSAATEDGVEQQQRRGVAAGAAPLEARERLAALRGEVLGQGVRGLRGRVVLLQHRLQVGGGHGAERGQHLRRRCRPRARRRPAPALRSTSSRERRGRVRAGGLRDQLPPRLLDEHRRRRGRAPRGRRPGRAPPAPARTARSPAPRRRGCSECCASSTKSAAATRTAATAKTARPAMSRRLRRRACPWESIHSRSSVWRQPGGRSACGGAEETVDGGSLWTYDMQEPRR